MIVIKEISKSFQGQRVLDQLSFQVERGQTLALLGLSGSGKTTALKTICGLHLPDQGHVEVDGERLTAANLERVRRKLGYVIQDGGLFPHLTARENIALVAREQRMPATQLEERLRELALMTKISMELLDRYPRELSGGQRQRIGIMRALLLNPEIMLLDEPMGALDPITRRELQLELKALFRELQKTVVLVTHDLHEATLLADQIILLSEGKVAQAGSMQDLLERPASDFVHRFVMAQDHAWRGGQ
jgi:osmoprotectant transport system ATP-binding protein